MDDLITLKSRIEKITNKSGLEKLCLIKHFEEFLKQHIYNIVDIILTIIIMEKDDNEIELTDDIKAVLDERLQEDVSTNLTAAESINQLIKKYGL